MNVITPVAVATVVAVGISVSPAAAQTYPSKPVRLIAASSPGSGVDIVGRIVAQKLGERLGQQVVVDNRAGAGGNLGAEIAAKAAPDGYTLFMGTPAQTINSGLYRTLNYDLVRDFAPVSLLTTGHYAIVVHPSLPVKSVKELTTLARARPGQLFYASAGSGNATHLAAALFSSMTHVELVHVPYKGSGPALTDLIGGQVQLMFSNLTAALPYVKAARLRALAVTGEKRSPAAPDLPTVVEAGVPGYVVASWFGILLPAGAPRELIMRLNSELAQVMRAPDVRERLATDGAEPTFSTPEKFGDFIKAEIAQWSKVIRDAKIAPE
ncbi:MAG TPA: tripartite tricarboxylate transporter substrate binding protein [Burkholderiales bacterium]|nr:tripartite tricarboxylate transporter substrate binding protein [Burkholderiales bacterium]